MNFSNLSFLNPLSKDSGVKLSKYAIIQRPEGADKIIDKTVIENCHLLYQDYKHTREKHLNMGLPDYGFFTEIGFTYKALTGLHHGVYTNLDEPKAVGVGGIGAKGLLDFLIFPLIARKLLWDSLIFIGNDENYRWSGTMDDLRKGICWTVLIPSLVFALSLEIIRLSLAATLAFISVYAALFTAMAALTAAILTAPIWFPIYTICKWCSAAPPMKENDDVEKNDPMNFAVLAIK